MIVSQLDKDNNIEIQKLKNMLVEEQGKNTEAERRM